MPAADRELCNVRSGSNGSGFGMVLSMPFEMVTEALVGVLPAMVVFNAAPPAAPDDTLTGGAIDEMSDKEMFSTPTGGWVLSILFRSEGLPPAVPDENKRAGITFEASPGGR